MLVADRYRLKKLLGKGGAGSVYLVDDLHTDTQQALKLLHAFAEKRSSRLRFEREFRAASRVHHPHCVQTSEFGEWGERCFYTMEYAANGTLAGRGKQFSHADVGLIALQLLAALDCIHAHNILHRDIKPPNILLFRNRVAETAPLVKLSDLGIAKIADLDEQVAPGIILGTERYIAPELAAGDAIDVRTDLYAVGIVLYELLTLSHPRSAPGKSEALPVQEIVHDVPPELGNIIGKLLRNSPNERYRTAAQPHQATNVRQQASQAPPRSR
jgi:serine/threonine-protein kinase